MNNAKSQTIIDGKGFLRKAFAAEQRTLETQLSCSVETITHDGVMGEVNEGHFISILRKYLPMRYAIDKGIVIDSNGATSDQIDIVIYDHQYTPTLLDQQQHRFIPAEAVYCVLEVKPTINKRYLEYAGAKANSVRCLERTSIPITHAGGVYQAKALFMIVAGIVAIDVDWEGGLASPAFKGCINNLTDNHVLDCGLALSNCSFDTVNGEIVLGPKSNSLAYFLFRLLQRLQSLGTVPAIDWNRYARVLGVEAQLTECV